MGIHWYTPPSHFEAMGHNQVYILCCMGMGTCSRQYIISKSHKYSDLKLGII